jgi:tRNA nucleotidyltransferase (CCA-adding enzyme)
MTVLKVALSKNQGSEGKLKDIILQVYLVGGAVRDKLLGRPVKEKDWVVVGACPEDMIAKRFKPVGKEFPVFLHPKTGEEYALARTERKVAKGYKGFEFYADPKVTLEEDLIRRDLTINAMAETDDGKIIDPFNGKKDLQNKILRHVSDAFAEDPVRILRAARFAAKFGDFTVAPDTLKLMKAMVESGEVDALVAERVWQEFKRALEEKYPERFFEVLRQCGALKIIFPEIDALFGIPGPKKHHPEVCSGTHTILALKMASKLGENDGAVNFAVLMHDLGKAESPKEYLPKHHGHEEKGAALVKKLCKRLHAPREYQDLALLVTKYHTNCHKIMELKPETILKIMQAIDPFRRPKRFTKFLIACEADVRGREGHENDPYPQADYFKKLYQACAKIDIKELIKDIPESEIPKVIYQKRLNMIRENMLLA